MVGVTGLGGHDKDVANTLKTVCDVWAEALRLNESSLTHDREGTASGHRFWVDPEYRKHQEALTLGPLAHVEGWLDYLCEEVAEGEGGDFRLWPSVGAESFDIEVTEVLDGQRRRTALYATPRAERRERPVRVGPAIPGEEAETDEFERPDELKVIRAKVERKRSGRYPDRTGLVIFNNVSAFFDDRPGVTLDRLKRAVAVTGAQREFGIGVVSRAIPTVPPQWPVCRIG